MARTWQPEIRPADRIAAVVVDEDQFVAGSRGETGAQLESRAAEGDGAIDPQLVVAGSGSEPVQFEGVGGDAAEEQVARGENARTVARCDAATSEGHGHAPHLAGATEITHLVGGLAQSDVAVTGAICEQPSAIGDGDAAGDGVSAVKNEIALVELHRARAAPRCEELNGRCRSGQQGSLIADEFECRQHVAGNRRREADASGQHNRAFKQARGGDVHKHAFADEGGSAGGFAERAGCSKLYLAAQQTGDA